jgi:hypothetical protein
LRQPPKQCSNTRHHAYAFPKLRNRVSRPAIHLTAKLGSSSVVRVTLKKCGVGSRWPRRQRPRWSLPQGNAGEHAQEPRPPNAAPSAATMRLSDSRYAPYANSSAVILRPVPLVAVPISSTRLSGAAYEMVGAQTG